METTNVWIDGKKWLPKFGTPFLAIMDFQPDVVRKCISGGTYYEYYRGYRFTDCTHSLQNIVCPISEITKWRYLNDEDYELHLPEPNYAVRQTEGDDILQSVNPPNLWTRIKYAYQYIIK